MTDRTEKLPNVTRVEVIDGTGRAYVSGLGASDVEMAFQDDGRTLKIFLKNPVGKTPDNQRQVLDY